VIEDSVTLTLTLSLRERGQIVPGLAFPPLPQGEGRGEGVVCSLSLRERAGVRVNSHLL